MKLKDCKRCINYHSHSKDGVMCFYYEDEVMERTLLIDFIIDCPRVQYIDKTVYH